MALFTDGRISEIADLADYDSSILDVAGAERVDLDRKLALAAAEIGVELQEFLLRRTGQVPGGRTAGLTLRNIVVTPALKQWHTLLALTLVYADVAGNHLESRYPAKEKEYRRRARRAADSLFRIGVGITLNPVPRAGTPEVRTIAGATPIQTYYVRIAWRNAADESGAPSELVAFTPSSDGEIAVKSPPVPENVAGYDVFVGLDADNLKRQNAQPLEPGAEWVMPPSGLVEGPAPDTGQEPAFFVRNDRVLLRG